MENNQKIKVTVFLIILLCSFLVINAQIETVNGFNYYDINRSAFTNNNNCSSLTSEELEERQYFYTSFDLAQTVDSIFKHSNDTIDKVVGSYIIYKRPYTKISLGGEKFTWILIRPNDNVERPVVHITHGGKTGGASELRVLSLGVYDYVQRGFAVVYYQSGSANGNSLGALEDAGLQTICYDTLQYCSSWSPDCDMDCFQQAVYLKSQLVKAALQFSAHYNSSFNLDKNLFFAIGYSGSAVGILTSTLATNNNFNDNIFSGMGSLYNLSIDSTSTYNLKAIKTLAGGFLDESSENYKIGPMTTTNVANTRFLMIHGQDDWAVQPETSPLIWSIPEKQLPGSQIKGSLSLKTYFDNNGITNKVIINCSSGHTVFTHPCEFNDDLFGNNPLFIEDIGGVCVKWATTNKINASMNENICGMTGYSKELFYVMQQIHDQSRIGAHFFHEDFSISGPSSENDVFINNILSTTDVSAVNPISFPFNKAENETNGHYIESTKCLQQTCSGLYFDKIGIGNSVNDFLGDYLTIPAYDTEIFNSNFTIEIKFKAIKQTGIATLFSHITDDLLKTGFEIYINSNGQVIFKKNVLGQGSILGTVDVLDDECHFVTLTREGNEFGLYVDGELQNNKKNFNIIFPSISNYRLGNTINNIGALKSFNGIIHNVKIWDATIEAENFMQTDIPSSTTNLMSEWMFEETKGQFLVSTNNSDTIFLGSDESSFFNDPRWMKNDEMCECNDENTVGVNTQIDIKNKISIHPNPTESQFVVSNNSTKREMKISIYNVQGMEIFNTITFKNHETINIKTKGIYLIKTQLGTLLETHKVVIK